MWWNMVSQRPTLLRPRNKVVSFVVQNPAKSVSNLHNWFPHLKVCQFFSVVNSYTFCSMTLDTSLSVSRFNYVSLKWQKCVNETTEVIRNIKG